jgi:upstream activation factor subunit UAF30
MKKLERENKKAKNKGNRQPSGFANPTRISKELCEFMDKPTDTKMARTDVTKYIIQYIKENNLQDPKNAKVIQPNKKLTTLLKIDSKSEVLTYFNIQRHMNKHFIKSA